MKAGLKLRGFLAFILVICIAVFAFAACDKQPDPTPTPGPEDGGNPDDGTGGENPDDGGSTAATELELISAGVVNFQVVKTGDLKSAGVKAAGNLVKELKGLGLTVGEVVADGEAGAVMDCEIIIGSGARLREGCNVDYHTLGKDGYVIKVVGKRVIIAGGTDDALLEAIDVFREKVLGITDTTESLAGATVKIALDQVYSKESYYDLLDIRVGEKGASLMKGFHLSYDPTVEEVAKSAYTVRNTIYDYSGLWLPLESELPDGESAKHLFIIRSVADSGDGGFRVFVDEDDNLIMECSFLFHMDRGVTAFLDEYVIDKTGVSRIYADEPFEHRINVVRYTEFGAKGDGKTDDYLAMYKTHEYANEHGIKVIEDQGLTYLMGPDSYGKTIAIKTDVDFGDATYIVDDSKLKPDMSKGKARSAALFSIAPSDKCKGVKVEKEVFEGISLKVGDENIGMTFDGPKMLAISSNAHNIYIRYGANENAGANIHENLLVAADGTIDPTTPLTFDYPHLTSVTAYSTEEIPITIEGGTFRTIANQLSWEFPEMPNYLPYDQYYYYSRNFNVTRSNTTVRNIQHYIEGEGEHGYPYSGFLSVSNCYNVLFEDCIVTGHRAYDEDRDGGDGSEPDGIIQDKEMETGTTMGSYDLSVSTAINATFRNIKQSNSITSNFYWGIMGSNYGRNVVYENCYLSRFDAHCGVYNAEVRDTTIGFAINLTGNGYFIAENVTKLVGGDLISLRSDYGSTWNGDIHLKNITMYGWQSKQFAEAVKTSNLSEYTLVTGSWADWEFGHDNYISNYIELDGFSTPSDAKSIIVNIYRYNNFTLSSQASKLNPLFLPEKIEWKISNIEDRITVYASNNIDYINELFASGRIVDLSEGEKKIKAR